MQVSFPLQEPSGQTAGHAPQSCGQVEQVSLPLQSPSGQEGGQVPQSWGQDWQSSEKISFWAYLSGLPVLNRVRIGIEMAKAWGRG